MLEGQKQKLNAAMESRFRAVFPDAVAVVDPSLQMRRKLAELRHGAGLPDDGDFLPIKRNVLPQFGVAARKLEKAVL